MIFRVTVLGLLGLLLVGCGESAETPAPASQPQKGSFQTAPTVLLPYQEEGRWGFLGSNGQVAIRPLFARVQRFSEGLAAAMDAETGRWGFLDPQGGWAISPKFDVVAPGGFQGGRASVAIIQNENRIWGLIDLNGQWRVQPVFSEPLQFADGLARAAVDGRYGFINPDGEFVIPATFSLARRFSNGLAAVLTGGESGPGRRILGGKWGLIDTTGQFAVEPYFSAVGDYAGGFSAVWFAAPGDRRPTFKGYVDKDGALAISLQRFDDGGPFCASRARVRDRTLKLWGFVDPTGALVISAEYSAARDFSENLAAVLVSDPEKESTWRWGYIDRDGQWAIKPAFSKAGDFKNGFAPVSQNGREGYIDTQGRWIEEK